MLCACSTIIFSGWEDSSFSVYDRVRVCVCVSHKLGYIPVKGC